MRRVGHIICVSLVAFAFFLSFFHGSSLNSNIGNSYSISSPLVHAELDESPSGRVINVPGDYATIQGAINFSNPGDTIKVGSGTYYENVLLNKNDVTLLGQGANDTIIDGNVLRNGLTIEANNVIVNGFMVKNSLTGILLDRASNCSIINNYVTGNKFGIYLSFTSNSRLFENRAVDNEHNLHLDFSPNNYFSKNIMQGDASYNFGLVGVSLADYIQTIDTSNTVNGKAIYYMANVQNLVIDPKNFPEIGDIIIVNSSRISVKDFSIFNSLDAVLFAYVSDSTVQNITAFNNKIGIDFSHSSNCTVSESTAVGDMYYGILLLDSSQCKVYGNNITGNFEGVYLTASNNCTVQDNTITNNDVSQIHLDNSFSNLFFHNNIMNKTSSQPNVYSINSTNNQFDNGVEGNFWSIYAGVDNDKDGIGDTKLPFENLDNHPLMGPITNFSAEKEKTKYAVEVVSNSSVDGVLFNEAKKAILLNASTPVTAGFVRIVIPQKLLDGPYTIWIDNSPPIFLNQETNGSNTQLYFTYSRGLHQIEIAGNITLPEAVAGPNQQAVLNTKIYFDGGKSHSNHNITSYSWDYGDGTTGSGITTTHVYEKTGNYTVSLKVMDSTMNVATDRCTISISAQSQNPNQDSNLLGSSLLIIIAITLIAELIAMVTIVTIIFKRKARP